VENGEAYAVKKLGENMGSQRVMDYSRGMYFGERALIKNEKRAATVIAKVKYLVNDRLIAYVLDWIEMPSRNYYIPYMRL